MLAQPSPALARWPTFFLQGELYWQKGPEAFDTPMLDGRIWPILRAIAERAPQKDDRDPKLAFPFASIARAFRVIDEMMEPVIVPWKARPDVAEAEMILKRVARMDRPLSRDLRKLQQYTVSIPPKARQDCLARDVLRRVHPALGDALLRFEDLAYYDDRTGVRLDDPAHRRQCRSRH